MSATAIHFELRGGIARLTLAQSDRGNPFDLAFIPRRVGSRRAAEFLMLNQTWSAEEAERNGLVSRVVDDDRLLIEAEALAAQFAAGPTRTFGEMRKLLLATFDTSLDTQLEMEARAIATCAKTEDSWNAIQSRLAKQKPVFSGR